MNWYVVMPGRVAPKKGFGWLLLLAKSGKLCVFISSESKFAHIISLPREAAWAKQLETVIAVAIAFTHYTSNKNSIQYFAAINPSD